MLKIKKFNDIELRTFVISDIEEIMSYMEFSGFFYLNKSILLGE